MISLKRHIFKYGTYNGNWIIHIATLNPGQTYQWHINTNLMDTHNNAMACEMQETIYRAQRPFWRSPTIGTDPQLTRGTPECPPRPLRRRSWAPGFCVDVRRPLTSVNRLQLAVDGDWPLLAVKGSTYCWATRFVSRTCSPQRLFTNTTSNSRNNGSMWHNPARSYLACQSSPLWISPWLQARATRRHNAARSFSAFNNVLSGSTMSLRRLLVVRPYNGIALAHTSVNHWIVTVCSLGTPTLFGDRNTTRAPARCPSTARATFSSLRDHCPRVRERERQKTNLPLGWPPP